ncbi:MAG: redox-regulated ATPase YchF [Candidatus Aminicenantes bacterium 4484_214]|nr:MAG: redox-regulated ATPase YchF [Candidatus Aminicenantes bacterium 4484_214]
MKFALFGFPQTGKTTLFNLLTGAEYEIASFPTHRDGLHQRTCAIPDERLEKLARLFPDKEKKPATIDFIDLAGFRPGELKTSAYLAQLRLMDGLAHVVRGFEAPQIPHLFPEINPHHDIQSMEEELILADLLTIEKRLSKLAKELRGKKTEQLIREKDLLVKTQEHLLQGKPLREIYFSPEEEKRLRAYSFLSQKPIVQIINVDETHLDKLNKPQEFLLHLGPKQGVMVFGGQIEYEISQLPAEEQQQFLREYGLGEFSIQKFLRISFQVLELINFYTVGKTEVKAWTIPQNTPAPQAAGVIHSDMEKGFIRAEVISVDDLLQAGSFSSAREKGLIQTHGKDYHIMDGDVVYFRFSP